MSQQLYKRALMARGRSARGMSRYHAFAMHRGLSRGDPGFFSSVGKIFKGAATAIYKIGDPLLRKVPGIGTAYSVAQAGLSALPGGKLSLFGSGKQKIMGSKGASGTFGSGFPTITPLAGGGPTITLTPEGEKMVAQTRRQFGDRAHRRRHINPMNLKAARRAISRIRGAHKLLERIERSLPHVRSSHHLTKPHHRKR